MAPVASERGRRPRASSINASSRARTAAASARAASRASALPAPPPPFPSPPVHVLRVGPPPHPALHAGPDVVLPVPVSLHVLPVKLVAPPARAPGPARLLPAPHPAGTHHFHPLCAPPPAPPAGLAGLWVRSRRGSGLVVIWLLHIYLLGCFPAGCFSARISMSFFFFFVPPSGRRRAEGPFRRTERRY